MKPERQNVFSRCALQANGAPSAEPVGRPVLRQAGQLRVHPALRDLGFSGVISEINQLAKMGDSAVLNPVLITKSGTILAGFERWRWVLSECGSAAEIHCVEYAISEDDSLFCILSHHQIRQQWNRFVLIYLALKLEPALQQKALENMQAGGRFKGSAILPKAEHIDVREQIANWAGASAHYVSDVKAILRAAHPELIEALRDGILSIPQAKELIKLPKEKQSERFKQRLVDKSIDKVIRKCLRTHEAAEVRADVVPLLKSLLKREAEEPGSIILRRLRVKGAEVVVLRDAFSPFGNTTTVGRP